MNDIGELIWVGVVYIVMSSQYADYHDTISNIHKGLLSPAIKQIGYKLFEDARGYSVTEVLPGDNEQYHFEVNALSGQINTETRNVYNILYADDTVSTAKLASNPTVLYDIIEEVHTAWFDTFGTETHRRSHPGNPPFSVEGLQESVTQLCEMYKSICADPTVSDLVDVITVKNYRSAMRFLGVETPEEVLDPSIGHELYSLFSNGEIHIVYQDDEIALLKPEYTNQLSAEEQQLQWDGELTEKEIIRIGTAAESWAERRFGSNIQSNDNFIVLDSDDPVEVTHVRGEEPQEAFVVGKDDTPTGLFAHTIDGTRLNPTQTVSKTQITDVMGFDTSFSQTHENTLSMSVGERIRLQGDLAIEKISADGVGTAGVCPIPIDNHYISLSKGVLPPNESKSQEPITVTVADDCAVNIAHDEHENVTAILDHGEYSFYLLPRGLQLQENRSDWTS